MLKFSYTVLKNVRVVYCSSEEIRVNNIDTILLTTVLPFLTISFSKIDVDTLLIIRAFNVNPNEKYPTF